MATQITSIIQEIPDVVQEKPGCGATLLSIIGVIAGVIIYNAITDEEEKKSSDSQKPKTEQVSTQTTNNKSSYSSTSNTKPTTSQSESYTYSAGSSNTTSNSSVTSSSESTASSSSASNSTAETDESYQIYLALSTLLENEGKSLKLCESLNKEKGQEANVIGKMRQLRGTKYYNNALKDIVRCCPKYASEYSKNGKYFASEGDFFQAYINPDYSKILKANKKNK
jgi:hypothetical protein